MSDQPIKVLLIEDNAADAFLITETLTSVKGAAFDVECAERLSSGLERLAEGDIDVVLLDLSLPDSAGFDTFAKTHARASRVPIVVLSGAGSEALAVRAVREGAQDYLVKGEVDGNLMARAIRYAIERKRAEEALRERTHDLGKRVNELSCLYATSGLVERRDIGWGEMLQEIVYLIPSAWQYPAITCARVTLDGEAFTTENFRETAWKQASDVTVHGERIGTVEVYYLEERPANDEGSFSQEERNLIDAIAERLGGAVGRRQAEEGLRRRNRELAALNRAGHAISSILDPDQVLVTLLEEVRRLMGVTATSVWLLDPETDELVCRQVTGPSAETVRGWRLAPGEGIAGWTARSGESLVVRDVRADEHYFSGVDEQTGLSLRSILSTPLWTKQRVIGVLQVVDTEVGRFSEADLELLEPLAASAAAAIENARLHEEALEEIVRRERAEETVRRERDLAESLIETAQAIVLVLDTEGRIVRFNPYLEEVSGYRLEEVQGKDWFGIFLPERDRERIRELFLQAVGDVQTRGNVNPIVTRDGREREIEWYDKTLKDAEGNVAGLLAVGQDITERQRAEEALRRRNEELSVLNAIAATVSRPLSLDQILRDVLGEVVQLNLLKATGKGVIFLLDEQAGELSLAAQRGFSQEQPCFTRALQVGECLCGLAVQRGEIVISDDGTQDERHSLCWPEMDPHKDICLPLKARDRTLGAMALELPVGQEVSDGDLRLLTAIGDQIGVAIENAQLAAEAAEVEVLQELDRLRSELIANVSHELRTPLGLVKILCTTLLREDVDLDGETRLEFLQDIDEETGKLEEIVDNLLDLSRMESGRLHLVKRPTDLGQLIDKVLADMAIQHAQYRFDHDLPSDPLTVTADPGRIEQVLRNLLSNAAKYSSAGSAVTVGVRGEKEQLHVWVGDRGIGISPEDLERIFERFYRVEGEATQRVRGAGLGLSVCQGIVEAHGGRIWAESKLGKGSTFHFTLPVEEGE